nr:acyltransferase [Ochrobactrum sp. UNC390CL2Tsu3S39]
MAISHSGKKRNQGLQALRGIAALLVFVHHLPWPTNILTGGSSIIQQMELGGAGVAVFFALSGYLMVHKVSLSSPTNFLIDRSRRIYPSLWLALILAAFSVWLMKGVFVLEAAPFFLMPTGKQAFTDVPYWTLIYEVGFYLLVFGSLLVSRKPVTIIVLALLGSYALAARPYVWTDVAFPTWYSLTFSLMSINFLTGIAVGWMPRLKGWLSIVVVGLLGAFLYWIPQIGNLTHTAWIALPHMFTEDGLFPRLIKAVGCGLVVWSAIYWNTSGLLGRTLSWFGDLSYGIYLIHISSMLLAGHYLGVLGLNGLPYYLTMAIIAVISLPPAMAFGWLDWWTHGKFKSFFNPGSRRRLSGKSAMHPQH